MDSNVGGYAEHAPPAGLRPFVECFWSRIAPGAGAPASSHRVLPDGCVDLILSLGAWSPAGTARPLERLSGAWFVGTMTRPLIVHSEPGTSFIGVRCRPGAALALFRVPASDLTDQRIAMDELWPDATALRERLERSGDAGESLRLMIRAVARRLAAAPPPPADVEAAVAAIRRSRGRIAIAALCAGLGVTRQHLARRFATHVGVPPKGLARVEPVRNVMRLSRTSGPSPWSRIALDAGYADQSHMINDFGELVGVAPAQWIGAGS